MNPPPTVSRHHRSLLWPIAGLALALLPQARATGAATPPPVKVGPASTVGTTDAEPQGLLRLGEALTKRGDYATAEIAYWQILHRPNVPLNETKTALLALAHVHRRNNEMTKAVAIYEKYLKDYPDDERVPDCLLELGRTLRDMGVYKMAISCFYSVINSTLKFPSAGFEHYQLLAKTAQFEIAQTHFEAGEYTEAGKYYSRVRLLELAPEDRARAHFMAAFAEQLAGDLDTAVSTLRAYLEAWPTDKNAPEARYLLATTLRQLKRPQESLAVTLDLLRAEHARVASDPERWSYWQRRTGNQVANEFFQNGDTFNALAIYRGLDALSNNPAWHLPLTYQIALCYERLRQLDQARQTYQKIVDAGNPDLGHPVSDDAADLARMASWRLAHLDWRDQAEHKISDLFPRPEDPPPPSHSSPSPPHNT